jgi:hypothetical protein
MKTPYLIQRAEINDSRTDEMRVSQAVRLDYMGSAEFEFGATAKSLRALEKAFLTRKPEDGDLMRVTDVAEITTKSRSGKQKPLKVLHCFTDEEFEQYIPYLHKMREGKLRAKENPRFEAAPQWPFTSNSINFWWDIENHVMWSFDHEVMRKLPLYLENSWKYMNEQKGE